MFPLSGCMILTYVQKLLNIFFSELQDFHHWNKALLLGKFQSFECSLFKIMMLQSL